MHMMFNDNKTNARPSAQSSDYDNSRASVTSYGSRSQASRRRGKSRKRRAVDPMDEVSEASNEEGSELGLWQTLGDNMPSFFVHEQNRIRKERNE